MTVAIDFSAHDLMRYPSKHTKDLRAWDAADEYLAEFLAPDSDVLLVNDAFGALACASALYGANSFHINDSWSSLKAIEINTHTVPEPYLAQTVNAILFKLPKSLSLLDAQLIQIANQLKQPVSIYFSGMQKHIGSGHLDIIKARCTDVEYLPTQRKARMYKARLSPIAETSAVHALPMPELQLTLQNVAGVFAEQKFDIGSRFFIEHFKLLPAARTVADVGCGNGLLALAYHRLHPEAQLTLIDESAAAVQSAQLGFAFNFPDADRTILHNDGLANITQIFDLILINPPFHQQNTVTTDIALALFAQAKACMENHSELWIAANRHLNYPADLKRWFRRIKIEAQNAKFMIIKVMF